MLGVETLVREISTITPEALKAADYEDDIEAHVPRFALFFGQLRLLLADNVRPEDEITLPTAELNLAAVVPVSLSEELPSTAQSASEPKKRPNSPTISTPRPAKIRPEVSKPENITPQTPDQPTVPKNPAYSGDSVESIDEDNTKQMIKTFVQTTLYSLGPDFIRIPWPSYAQKCRLRISGSLLSSVGL